MSIDKIHEKNNLLQIRNERKLYERHKNPPSGSRGVPKPSHWEDLFDCFSQIEDIEPKFLMDGIQKKGKAYKPPTTNDDSEGKKY